jgi:hypothetical protein
LLTLYITPVIYVYLERARNLMRKNRGGNVEAGIIREAVEVGSR